MTSSPAWDAARRETRRLETDLDAKLLSYSQLAHTQGSQLDWSTKAAAMESDIQQTLSAVRSILIDDSCNTSIVEQRNPSIVSLFGTTIPTECSRFQSIAQSHSATTSRRSLRLQPRIQED